MKKALLPILALILAVGLVLSVTGPAAAQEPSVTIQLVVLLDASSSMDSHEWSTQIDGLAAAITNCIPHDGSVELTVVTFYTTRHWDWWRRYYTTHTDVVPTLNRVQITAGNAASVAAAVQAISQPRGSKYTPLASAIDAATEELTGNAIPGARQIINICTDGDPNINRAGTAQVSEANAKDDAVAARNDAIGDSIIDEISAEAIGDISDADIDWLRDSIVYPEPGHEAPSSWEPGWVYEVGTRAHKFKEAICHKIGYTPPTPHTLMIIIDGSGSVTKNPAPPYADGTLVELTAIADPEWTFIGWSGDLSGSDSPETIVMDGDKTVTATFTQDTQDGYTLTINTAGGGLVTRDPDLSTYADGTSVELTANADPGWTFSSWSGALTGSTSPDTITMDGDKDVTATFTEDGTQEGYTLTIRIYGSGSVTADGLHCVPYLCETTYADGTLVELTATADPQWTFSSWSKDLHGSITPATITMDGTKNVTALFTQEEFPTPGCFIATAAYGSNLDGHVDTLRAFRDQYLVTNPVGSSFVSLYYKTSPPIAEFIDDHPALKPMVRAALLPAVALSTVTINTTAAQMVAMAGGIALVSIILAMWLRQRSRRLGSADKRL